jgi:hypothetical protein
MITRLIPKVFFSDMRDGFELFVDCLGFKVLHHSGELAVVERDGAKFDNGRGALAQVFIGVRMRYQTKCFKIR